MKITILHTEQSDKGTSANFQQPLFSAALREKKKAFCPQKRLRSSKDFYQNFRDRVSIVTKFLKDQAKFEEVYKEKTGKRERKIKTTGKEEKKTEETRLKQKKSVCLQSLEPFAQTGIVYSMSLPTINSRGQEKGNGHRKMPASLSAIQLNPEIVPESKENKTSLKELNAFLCYRSRSFHRFR
jgi:hypothetical protein